MVQNARQTHTGRVRSRANVGDAGRDHARHGKFVGLQGMHSQRLCQKVICRLGLVLFQNALGLGPLPFSHLLLGEPAEVVHPSIGEEGQTPAKERVQLMIDPDFGQIPEVVVKCLYHAAVVGPGIQEPKTFIQLARPWSVDFEQITACRLTVMRAMVSNATVYD
jgi:hypothetical protein